MLSITGLLITCLIHQSTYGLPDTQIIGGSDAPDGEYPYQASLRRGPTKTHFCSGAIVSKRYVITVAHCLTNLNSSDVNVAVGSNNLYNLRKDNIYEADNIIIHPNYNQTINRYLNDIGFIRLKKDIAFNTNIKEIKLIPDNPDFHGVKFVVTGWGMNNTESGLIASRLQNLTVTGFSQTNCAAEYRNKGINITDGHVCTRQAWGKGVCFGDSGAPLTSGGKLVGLVTKYNSCGEGDSDVYTRVYHYKSWIEETINAGSNQQLNIILGLFLTYLSIHLFL